HDTFTSLKISCRHHSQGKGDSSKRRTPRNHMCGNEGIIAYPAAFVKGFLPIFTGIRGFHPREKEIAPFASETAGKPPVWRVKDAFIRGINAPESRRNCSA